MCHDREEARGPRGRDPSSAATLLVQAVTQPADGSDDRLYGNFPSYTLYPDTMIAGAMSS